MRNFLLSIFLSLTLSNSNLFSTHTNLPANFMDLDLAEMMKIDVLTTLASRK